MASIPRSSNVSLEIIVKGDGKNFPKPGQTVSVHYTGYVCKSSQHLFL